MSWLTEKLHSSVWTRLLLATVLGALFPLGFAPLDWWFMPLISVGGLWALLAFNAKIKHEPKSSKSDFWLGFFYGLGQFGVGVSWVYVSINTFGNAPPALATLLTLGFVAILSLFPALFALLLSKVSHRLKLNPYSISYAILFATLWLLIDLARGSGFVSFPWLYLGYSQTEQLYRGIAAILGVHGLTFLLAILSIAITQFVKAGWNRKKTVASGLIAMSLMVGMAGLSLVGILQQSDKDQALTLALIQPNVDQKIKWNSNYYSSIVGGLEQQTESYWGADLIVWPEAAIPRMDRSAQYLLKSLEEKAQDNNSFFMTGIPILGERPKSKGEKQPYYAGIKLYGGEKEQSYYKQQLVPFGEYLPLESWIRGLIDFFNLPMSSFSAGSDSQAVLRTPKASIIPAICYEIAFSGLVNESRRKIEQDEFQVIVTISNDTWFGASWGPLQHAQMAQMRALENGVPVIRATNNGLTAVINSRGQIIEHIERFTQDELAGLYLLQNRPTLFSQYGYWLLLLLIVALLGGLYAFSVFKRR